MSKMRCKIERPGRGGWTRWVQPRMRRYFLKCCDCGLVHEMTFRIAANNDGSVQRVQFKARRHKP